MTPERFEQLTSAYPRLRVAVLGDFCLDRYLEIDPARRETSLETGLPVHNVTNVRAQPGGAGTIINNLAALGVRTIYPVGIVGEDGEGYELCRALEALPGLQLKHLVRAPDRHTFTYCKPLVLEPGKPPVELNRLDLKNWTPTPVPLQELVLRQLQMAANAVDALIVLEQVDIPDTGVITRTVLMALRDLLETNPGLVVLADSRRGLREFPPMVFKMNAAELAALKRAKGSFTPAELEQAASELALRNRREVFITLAERGMLGANRLGQVQYAPALPVRGPIDIVGAGDAVSANLTTALAAGATVSECLELANAAASVVIHKLGTTGTASVAEICDRLQ